MRTKKKATPEEIRSTILKSLEGLPDHQLVTNAVDDLVAAGVEPSDKQFSIAFGGATPRPHCEHTAEALREKLEAAAAPQPPAEQVDNPPEVDGSPEEYSPAPEPEPTEQPLPATEG